eukprot:TRINITY_DN14150_c0_g4_i1.p1 TRINITY_DN14150_c0_g4~~TRINITY_DN14150_c0_g4_i1.p1  ORF type:complete len:408 (+),score=52.54 TRINITY_DN14150_c0_g4_i1:132-1226(+)
MTVSVSSDIMFFFSAEQKTSSDSISRELEGVSLLLSYLCDAVVKLDDGLRLTDDSPQLAGMLLQGTHRNSLAGRKIEDFLPTPEEKSRLREQLLSYQGSHVKAAAFTSNMLDSNGNNLVVELMHVRSVFNGTVCHLVGIRESSDTMPLCQACFLNTMPDMSTLDEASSMTRPLRENSSGENEMLFIYDPEENEIIATNSNLTQYIGKDLSGKIFDKVILNADAVVPQIQTALNYLYHDDERDKQKTVSKMVLHTRRYNLPAQKVKLCALSSTMHFLMDKDMSATVVVKVVPTSWKVDLGNQNDSSSDGSVSNASSGWNNITKITRGTPSSTGPSQQLPRREAQLLGRYESSSAQGQSPVEGLQL